MLNIKALNTQSPVNNQQNQLDQPEMSKRGKESDIANSNHSMSVKSWHTSQIFKTPPPRQAIDSDLCQSFLSSKIEKHPNQCLCQDCVCGRHLCKIQSPALSLTISSTYKSHYPPRKPYRQTTTKPEVPKIPQTPLLSVTSTYFDDFTEGPGDPLQRPQPEDLMKCRGGPGAKLTSYREEYPGHRGKNQYVPVNPEQSRGGLKFDANSSYSKEFQKPRGHSAENAKPADQFRMTGSWLGHSTYKDQFQSPTSSRKRAYEGSLVQSQCSSRSKSSAYAKERNPSCHFRTTYGSDFLGKGDAACPAAKKALVAKEEFVKSSFQQNSHFRGMDSHYSSLARNGTPF